jgi:Glycosyl hydrolases family 16.
VRKNHLLLLIVLFLPYVFNGNVFAEDLTITRIEPSSYSSTHAFGTPGSKTLTFRAAVAAAYGIQSVDWYVGSSFKYRQSFTAMDYFEEVNKNFTFSGAGTYFVSAVGVDKNGLTREVAWQVVIKIEDNDPIISRDYPSSSSESYTATSFPYSKTFRVDVGDVDGNLERVYWYINGNEYSSTSVSGSSDSASKSIIFSSAGAYNVGAQVVDENNNSKEVAWAITISEADRDPEISRNTPSSSSATFAASSFPYSTKFWVDVTDADSNLSRVDWYVDGNPIGSSSISGGSASTSKTISFDRAGTYNVGAAVVDSKNNTDEIAWSITVEVPDKDPVITRSTPSSSSHTFSTSSFPYIEKFWVNVTDADDNLSRVDWYLNGNLVSPSSSVSGGSVSVSKDITFPSQGSYNVGAVAVDSNNNTAEIAWTIAVENTNQAPQVERNTPASSPTEISASGFPYSTKFWVNATDTDNNLSRVDWYLNGSLVSPSSSISGGNVSVSKDITFPNEGNYNVGAVVVDSNDSTSELAWQVIILATEVVSVDAIPASTVVDNALTNEPVTLGLRFNDPEAKVNRIVWSFSDGSSSVIQEGGENQYTRSISHRFASAGEYQVTAKAYDNSDAVIYSAVFTVKVAQGSLVSGEHTAYIDKEPGVLTVKSTFTSSDTGVSLNYPFIEWDNDNSEVLVRRLDFESDSAISDEATYNLGALMLKPLKVTSHLKSMLAAQSIGGGVEVTLPYYDSATLSNLADYEDRYEGYLHLINDMVNLTQYKSNYAYQKTYISDYDEQAAHGQLVAMGYSGDTYLMFGQFLRDLEKSTSSDEPSRLSIGGNVSSLGAFAASALSVPLGKSYGITAIFGDLANILISIKHDMLSAKQKDLAGYLLTFTLRQGEVAQRIIWFKENIAPKVDDPAFDAALTQVENGLFDPEGGFVWKALGVAREVWEYGMDVLTLIVDCKALYIAKVGIALKLLAVDATILAADSLVDNISWASGLFDWEFDQALSANISHHISVQRTDFAQALYTASVPTAKDYQNYKIADTFFHFLALRDLNAGIEAASLGENDGLLMNISYFIANDGIGWSNAGDYVEWANGEIELHLAALERSYELNYLAKTLIKPVAFVSIANQPPTLSVISSYTVQANNDLIIPIEVADADPLDIVVITPHGLPEGAIYNMVTKKVEWTPKTNDVGTHTFTLTASDGLNSVEQSIVVHVQAPPTLSPSLSIGSPAYAITVENAVSICAFSGTASDPDGTVVFVQYRINGGSWLTAVGTTSWSFTATGLGYGDNTVDVKSIDNDSNPSEITSRVVTRSISSDPLPAESITLIYPTGGEKLVVGQQISVQWATEGDLHDTVDIQYTVNGGVTWEHMTSVPDTGSYSWTVHPDACSEYFRLKVLGYKGAEVFYDTSSSIDVSPRSSQSRDLEDWAFNPRRGTIAVQQIDYRDALAMVFPANSNYPGPGESVETTNRRDGNTTLYKYGVFEGRLQAAPCAVNDGAGSDDEGMISALFTYWREKQDDNANDKVDTSEIDIELLGHDPGKVYMTIHTAELASSATGNELAAVKAHYVADIRSGKLYRYDYVAGQYSQYATLDAKYVEADFDCTDEARVYGFEWQADFVEWYMYDGDAKVVLARHNSADGVLPEHPAHFLANVWHTTDWKAFGVTYASSLKAPAASAPYYINWISSPSPVVDSDGDNLADSWEVDMFGSCYYDANEDNDDDELTNVDEYQNGTNPTINDSDGDLMPDGWEVSNELNPLVNDAGGNPDNDVFTNLKEYQNGTDPKVSNSGGNHNIAGVQAAIQLLLLSDYSATDIPKDGLVAEYLFEKNANDTSSRGLDGTAHSATMTTGHNGQANSAYSFDGNWDYIEVGSVSDFNLIHDGESFAISVWVKHQTSSDIARGVLGNSIGGDRNGFFLSVRGRGLSFSVGTSAPSYAVFGKLWEDVFPAGEAWNHIVVSYNKTTAQYNLFINGTNVNDPGTPTNPHNTGNAYYTLKIGTSKIVPSYNWFAGSIDDLRFYNRVLTEKEIKALAQ